jgi:hypothetical protein
LAGGATARLDAQNSAKTASNGAEKREKSGKPVRAPPKRNPRRERTRRGLINQKIRTTHPNRRDKARVRTS